MTHGPRYEPDNGPRYAPGCGPRYAPDRRPRYAPDQPGPLEPAAGVSLRLCARGSDSDSGIPEWDRTRTRPTGVYTPLGRTTRTALPACTRYGPQPLARDPAGAGGVAWASPGWIWQKAETAAEPSRDQDAAL